VDIAGGQVTRGVLAPTHTNEFPGGERALASQCLVEGLDTPDLERSTRARAAEHGSEHERRSESEDSLMSDNHGSRLLV
jgi:hypothetical protein